MFFNKDTVMATKFKDENIQQIYDNAVNRREKLNDYIDSEEAFLTKKDLYERLTHRNNQFGIAQYFDVTTKANGNINIDIKKNIKIPNEVKQEYAMYRIGNGLRGVANATLSDAIDGLVQLEEQRQAVENDNKLKTQENAQLQQQNKALQEQNQIIQQNNDLLQQQLQAMQQQIQLLQQLNQNKAIAINALQSELEKFNENNNEQATQNEATNENEASPLSEQETEQASENDVNSTFDTDSDVDSTPAQAPVADDEPVFGDNETAPSEQEMDNDEIPSDSPVEPEIVDDEPVFDDDNTPDVADDFDDVAEVFGEPNIDSATQEPQIQSNLFDEPLETDGVTVPPEINEELVMDEPTIDEPDTVEQINSSNPPTQTYADLIDEIANNDELYQAFQEAFGNDLENVDDDISFEELDEFVNELRDELNLSEPVADNELDGVAPDTAGEIDDSNDNDNQDFDDELADTDELNDSELDDELDDTPDLQDVGQRADVAFVDIQALTGDLPITKEFKRQNKPISSDLNWEKAKEMGISFDEGHPLHNFDYNQVTFENINPRHSDYNPELAEQFNWLAERVLGSLNGDKTIAEFYGDKVMFDMAISQDELRFNRVFSNKDSQLIVDGEVLPSLVNALEKSALVNGIDIAKFDNSVDLLRAYQEKTAKETEFSTQHSRQKLTRLYGFTIKNELVGDDINHYKRYGFQALFDYRNGLVDELKEATKNDERPYQKDHLSFDKFNNPYYDATDVVSDVFAVYTEYNRFANLSYLRERMEAQKAGIELPPLANNNLEPTKPSYQVPDVPLGVVGDGVGAKQRLQDNITAILLADELERENRLASFYETAQLKKFTGFAGLGNAFYNVVGRDVKDKTFNDNDRQALLEALSGGKLNEDKSNLKELMASERYTTAMNTTLTAYYTPPVVADAMWRAIETLGIKDSSRVLEPSMGNGLFLDTKTRNFNITACELDKLSSQIGKHLHPTCTVKNGDYLKLNDTAQYDLVIGNPPYDGNMTVNSHCTPANKKRIHEAFVIKGMEALRPNGVQAFVVPESIVRGIDSNDSTNSALSDYLFNHCDVVAGVRLPNDTFSQQGADVDTSIVMLRKLTDEEQQERLAISEKNKNAKLVFDMNTDLVQNVTVSTRYGEQKRWQRQDGKSLVELSGILNNQVQAYKDNNPDKAFNTYDVTPVLDNDDNDKTVVVNNRFIEKDKDNAFDDNGIGSYFKQDGEIYYRHPDGFGTVIYEQYEPKGSKAQKENNIKRMSDYIDLAQATTDLVKMQVDKDADNLKIEEKRQEINQLYDNFVERHGFLNTPNVEANDKYAGLNNLDANQDHQFALVKSLEVVVQNALYKDKEKVQELQIEKAPIFTTRTAFGNKSLENTDNLALAVQSSYQLHERVHLDYIAEVMDIDVDEVIERGRDTGVLEYNYATSEYEERSRFYSGDVVKRIEANQYLLSSNRLEGDDKRDVERQIENLQKARNPIITLDKIEPKISHSYIPDDIINGFLKQYGVGSRKDFVGDFRSAENTWGNISSMLNKYTKDNPKFIINKDNGVTATKIFDHFLNGKIAMLQPTTKQKEAIKETKDINEKKALATQYKIQTESDTRKMQLVIDDLNREFESYITCNVERMQRVENAFNDRFNRYVARKYDGSNLEFNGLNENIQLRPTQKNAIARIMEERATILNHEVGAGKTLTCIASVMKQSEKSNGQSKALIVCPNPLTSQWEKDFIKSYPSAKILKVSPDDYKGDDNKKMILSKIATGDYDAVIMSQSIFEKIPLSPESVERVFEDIVDDYAKANPHKVSNRDDLQAHQALYKKTVERATNNYKEYFLTLDQLGFDMLVLDEAQMYKNLMFDKPKDNISGLGSPSGSNRANDTYFKIQSILGENPNSKLIFASGTPVSNSMTEIYTLMRYTQKDTLNDMNIHSLTDWLKTFGDVGKNIEVSETGGLKTTKRLTKTLNNEVLSSILGQVMDIVTNEDMVKTNNVKLPEVEYHINNIPQTEQQKEYTRELQHRVMNRTPKDNILKITSDAQKASLAFQLLDKDYKPKDGEVDKVMSATDQMVSVYNEPFVQENKGVQLIFCDSGTPKPPKGLYDKEAIKEFIGTLDCENKEAKTIEKFLNLSKEAMAEKIDKFAEVLDKDTEEGSLTKTEENLLDEYNLLGEYLSGTDYDLATILEPDDPNKFIVYDYIKKNLMTKGVPENEIAYIHDANTEDERQLLFDKVNKGEIRFLIGSTAKMGAGVNVQQRVCALHHMDVKWKPDEQIQREGRGIRQGNLLLELNPDFKLKIFNHVTENSLEIRQYELNKTKIKGIRRLYDAIKYGATEGEFAGVNQMEANLNEILLTANNNALANVFLQTNQELDNIQKKLRVARGNHNQYIKYGNPQFKDSIIEKEKRLSEYTNKLEKLNLSDNELGLFKPYQTYNSRTTETRKAIMQANNAQFIQSFGEAKANSTIKVIDIENKTTVDFLGAIDETNLKEAGVALNNTIIAHLEAIRDGHYDNLQASFDEQEAFKEGDYGSLPQYKVASIAGVDVWVSAPSANETSNYLKKQMPNVRFVKNGVEFNCELSRIDALTKSTVSELNVSGKNKYLNVLKKFNERIEDLVKEVAVLPAVIEEDTLKHDKAKGFADDNDKIYDYAKVASQVTALEQKLSIIIQSEPNFMSEVNELELPKSDKEAMVLNAIQSMTIEDIQKRYLKEANQSKDNDNENDFT